MTKTKGKRLTRAVVLQRLNEAWDEVLSSCFGLTQERARQYVKRELDSGDDTVSNTVEDNARLFKAAVDMTLGKIGRDGFKKHARNIKTEEDLARAIERIREKADEIPSALRKTMKTVATMMPRKGGPGRQPKLSVSEASRACDHIATFIRQKHSVKAALEKTADLSARLFGKKVSARTLQKAWKDRDRLTTQ